MDLSGATEPLMALWRDGQEGGRRLGTHAAWELQAHLVDLDQMSAPDVESARRELLLAENPRSRTTVPLRWARLATTHRSYLYEHANQFPHIGASALSLLEQAGTAAFNLALITQIARHNPGYPVKKRNEEVARLNGPLRTALVRLLDLPSVTLVGKGLAGEIENAGGPSSSYAMKVMEPVLYQVLGVLSLHRAHATIAGMVGSGYQQALRDAAPVLDYNTIFQRHFETIGGGFEVTRTGPDHDTVFEATARVPDGRSATGRAPAKRQAKRMAARRFLEVHRPDLLVQAPESRAPAVAPQSAPRTTLLFATRLARSFSVQEQHADLFVRALMHSSWVYERFGPHDVPSLSNATLAHLGSFVVADLVARAQATKWLSITADPDSEQSTIHSIPSRDLVPLCEKLDLARHLLTGAGQRSSGVTVEMASDGVQAVLAAAYLAHGEDSRLEAYLPEAIEEQFRAITSRIRLDYFTQLDRQLVMLGLRYEASFTVTGPIHDTTYRCTSEIRSVELGQKIVISGRGRSKRVAQQAAAEPLVDLLTATVGQWSTPVPTAGKEPKPEHIVVSFLLRHQLAVLPDGDAGRLRWLRQGYLAGRLAAEDDFTAFRRWTYAVTPLIPEPPTSSNDVDNLAAYYAFARSQRPERGSIAQELDRVLSWVRECHARGPQRVTSQSGWQSLLALCAVQRVRLDATEARPFQDVLDDWSLLHSARLRQPIEAHDLANATIRGAVGVGLMLCLTELAIDLPGAAITTVRRLDQQRAVIELTGSPDWLRSAQSSPAIQLVCEALPEVTTVFGDKAVRLDMELHDGTKESWLEVAWHRALRSETDAEVARVLHDLKNELVASQVAIEQESVDRTSRLANELQANRHLDNALAFADRLAGASLLYVPHHLAPISLRSFFRSYLHEKSLSVPSPIDLISPRSEDATVTADPSLLRAVLDNLVKNAVEAMPDRGEIGFDWTNDIAEGVAIIEISDTGPGLSPDVAAALDRGVAVSSTKRQGSGLGLISSRRLIQRMAGTIHASATSRGHSWLLTLPLADRAKQDAS